MSLCIVYPQSLQTSDGKRKKNYREKGCLIVAEGLTVDTKAPSQRPAAETACTGRPGPLKDWESDSFPRGFPTSLHFRKAFSFSCCSRPAKNFSPQPKKLFYNQRSLPLVGLQRKFWRNWRIMRVPRINFECKLATWASSPNSLQNRGSLFFLWWMDPSYDKMSEVFLSGFNLSWILKILPGRSTLLPPASLKPNFGEAPESIYNCNKQTPFKSSMLHSTLEDLGFLPE